MDGGGGLLRSLGEVAEGVVSMSAFWADVLVAEGLILRRWDPGGGDYRYAHALHAPSIGDPIDATSLFIRSEIDS